MHPVIEMHAMLKYDMSRMLFQTSEPQTTTPQVHKHVSCFFFYFDTIPDIKINAE